MPVKIALLPGFPYGEHEGQMRTYGIWFESFRGYLTNVDLIAARSVQAGSLSSFSVYGGVPSVFFRCSAGCSVIKWKHLPHILFDDAVCISRAKSEGA